MPRELKAKNPHLRIGNTADGSFGQYGKIINGYDFAAAIDWVSSNVAIPEAVAYEASLGELEALPIRGTIETHL
jgi:hypothetical protein